MTTQFNTDASHQTIQKHTLERHIEKLKEQGFEYIGGYLNNKSLMQIRCTKCGTVRTVTGDYIGRKPKPNKYSNIKCYGCMDMERQQKKQKAEQDKLLKQLCTKIRALTKQKARALTKQKAKVNVFICSYCGKAFESKRKKKYCTECARKLRNRNSWRIKEMKVRNALVDRDITLDKLYERDNGICYLCGKPCDKEDYVVRDGTIITGNNYPSIEHVKPLSKGGKHEWKNIKLAHRICNTLKSNKEYISPYCDSMALAVQTVPCDFNFTHQRF